MIDLLTEAPVPNVLAVVGVSLPVIYGVCTLRPRIARDRAVMKTQTMRAEAEQRALRRRSPLETRQP